MFEAIINILVTVISAIMPIDSGLATRILLGFCHWTASHAYTGIALMMVVFALGLYAIQALDGRKGV